MQPAEHRLGDHSAPRRSGGKGGNGTGRSLTKASMRPLAVVVANELIHDSLQMPFVEDKHVIQALPSERPDKPLRNRIGLRRPDGRADFPDPEGADLAAEFVPINAVPVADQVFRRFPLEAGVDHMLPRPRRRRVAGHPDMDDLSRRVVDQKEHVQRLERQRPHRQKITRPNVLRMPCQELFPLRGRLTRPGPAHVPPHRPWRNHVSQLQQLRHDPRNNKGVRNHLLTHRPRSGSLSGPWDAPTATPPAGWFIMCSTAPTPANPSSKRRRTTAPLNACWPRCKSAWRCVSSPIASCPIIGTWSSGRGATMTSPPSCACSP